MRLDTDAGQRELAVEQEVQRLAAINPASRERLRALAQFNLSQPAAERKPVDREAQYMVLGYAPADAAANARFDADLEQRLNARTQKARPDAITGERIVQRYNPNSERERVAAEEKEMHALRGDARQRAAAQEMPSVVRGLAQGAGGLYAASMGAVGLAGELTGNEDLRDWGLEGYRETMRGVNNIRLAPTFTGIRSTGDAVEWALENSGYAGFQAATTILSAGMGGLIANTVGKKALGEAVGIALNSTVQTFGSVYGEAAEEARRSGKPLDLPTMLAGATVSTAIDTLADRIGLNALSTQTFKVNALERLGKSVGTQMAVQGGTEAAQRVPEELGVGRAPFREGTGAQYVDDFAAGALFGAHAGTVGGLRGGEPKGTPAQLGARGADVPVVGEQHTTPMPPVNAEQASALPEDLLAPSDLPPDLALGGAERADQPEAQRGSGLAMASKPAAHVAQPAMDFQGDAAHAGQAQEVAQLKAAAVLRMNTQPTGTLAVTGDPAVVRDALLQAGVVAEDIFPGSQGALVAPRSAERAWGILSPLMQAPDAGSGLQGPVLPVASPALTRSHPRIALLDGGSLALTGGEPAEIAGQLIRAGIGEAEWLQIPGGVLVPPASVQKVLQIFSATGAEKLVPARSGSHNGAEAFDGSPAWPMHALPPGPVFANRFPDDARELRDVPALTTGQALRMPANVLYVVKENGALIMARKPNDPGGFGHVDLARGEKVIAAGEAKVLWGTVKHIDNASGHYLPNGEAAAAAAVKAFRNHGFQVSDERYINKIFDFKIKKWVKK